MIRREEVSEWATKTKQKRRQQHTNNQGRTEDGKKENNDERRIAKHDSPRFVLDGNFREDERRGIFFFLLSLSLSLSLCVCVCVCLCVVFLLFYVTKKQPDSDVLMWLGKGQSATVGYF